MVECKMMNNSQDVKMSKNQTETLDQPSGLPQEDAILNKKAKVGVMGLGYVGLPLIRTFAAAGFQTLGFDVDAKKIECLLAGQSYIEHIPSDWIGPCVNNGSFQPTADMNRLAEADAILICVPTPLNKSRDPDLFYVEDTARRVAEHLRPGQLVILESTTYPGTTRDVVLPILEKTGLKLGKDFYLAYSPEREDPGNPDFSAGNIPKVVGGSDLLSLRLAAQLYRQGMPQVIPVSNCEVAEACKILENTYRAVNIAMVNELKILFNRLGIDVWEVIDAAKTKPFGFQAFYPGPGLGGHCIPIDPFYLTWLARCAGMSTRFIELAGEVNTSMPDYVIQRLVESLNDRRKSLRGSKVCVLGISYKKDVDDTRESPAFELMELLLKGGAELSYNDPHVPRLRKVRKHNIPLTSSELTAEFLASLDCVLIATDHSAYDYDFIVKHANLVVDTRNATKNVCQGREKIVKA
jgi:UDP-N-acetyl-D-glucosamine dehydrogenase